ncbi:hypothetical protein DPMN_083985 [Dreissena polymorpha]|uniref:Uncharacterized protein n=1 Tax=Dreissena polymorpha TaxID=45954 RepID=A0A9D4BI73_DREPO|nr:hypothetical protein DPMN_083985 [Dreissena polymorpha]
MICQMTWRISGGLERKFDVVNACTLAHNKHDLLSYVCFTFFGSYRTTGSHSVSWWYKVTGNCMMSFTVIVI